MSVIFACFHGKPVRLRLGPITNENKILCFLTGYFSINALLGPDQQMLVELFCSGLCFCPSVFICVSFQSPDFFQISYMDFLNHPHPKSLNMRFL